MESAAIRRMPDAPSSPGEPSADRGNVSEARPSKATGWPLWLRILLAVVVLSFVWSPFLAMLMRLSRVNPGLQPTGAGSQFSPPGQPGAQAPSPGPAESPPAQAPSP